MPQTGASQPPVSVPRSVVVQVLTAYEERRVRARACVLGEVHDAHGGRIVLELRSTRTQQVFARRTIRRWGTQEVVFDTKRIPFGCCAFRAQFVDRHGLAWETHTLHERSFGQWPWLGSSEGIAGQAPAPWTPLTVSRRGGATVVACWGREYAIGGHGLVAAIAATGAALLAAPVAIAAVANGTMVRWPRLSVAVLARETDRVVLLCRGMGSVGLELMAHVQIDVDGMLRLDWRLTAQHPVRLDALAVEIPVRTEVARYLYHFPGKWGESRNVGALPASGVRLGFHPFVWLGDEQRGLSWFAESDCQWELAVTDREAAIQVVPRGEATRLRLNLVTRPVRLLPAAAGPQPAAAETGTGVQPAVPGGLVTTGLQYSMGLQATPVKPVQEDAWGQRIFCIGQSTEGVAPRLRVAPALLDRLVAAGVRTVVLFEHWADAEGYVRTPHGAAVRRIVRDCHARGLRVLLYFSFLISDRVDEWAAIGKDCLVLPKGGYPVFHYQPQPEQSAWRVCLHSHYQDLLVHGIARAMDEYGVDGVYLDGTEYPFPCTNTEHGCGRVRADGTIAPTYPLFAVRSAMRRIHAVVRSRRQDGLVNVHNSTCMTIPTLGWATSYWDGEQFQGVTAGADPMALLPLDAFRAEFMGHQWGVPAEFLLAGAAYTYEQAWSFALLHDVPVRPNSVDDLELMAGLWRVMDEFGRTEAEWLPYWRSAPIATARPTECRISVYRHPRRGVLAVLSHLGRKPAVVRWRLDLGALGLGGGPVRAVDAVSRAPVELRAGGGVVELPPLGWRLVWVGPADVLAALPAAGTGAGASGSARARRPRGGARAH